MSLTDKLKVGAIATLAVGVLAVPMCSYHKTDTVDTVITKTLEKRSGDGEKYLIFTQDGEYENTDSLLHFKFNSSSVQNEADQLTDKNVRITKYGWRVPIFSTYENVTDIGPR